MNIIERITDYLSNGGLFNPEQMEHDKVRDLLVECRAQLTASESERTILTQSNIELKRNIASADAWADQAESQLTLLTQSNQRLVDVIENLEAAARI